MPWSEGYAATNDGVRLYFGRSETARDRWFFQTGFISPRFRAPGRWPEARFHDVRNRGKSDAISDGSKLQRGIHNDVDDLDAVRRHFGIVKLDVIGHSYMGVMVALYAMKFPEHTNRVVQIGPAEPEQGKEYPEHLRCHDAAQRKCWAGSDK